MNHQSSLRNVFIACILFGIGLLFTSLTLLGITQFGGDAAGPQQVFESHLAALDAQDTETAAQYTLDECSLPDVLPDFAYRRSFRVKEVWISADGEEAILGLIVPAGLPNIALLEKVEGEWLITC